MADETEAARMMLPHRQTETRERSRIPVRVLLCVLGFAAGFPLLPPEASAQTTPHRATYKHSNVQSFLTGVTSPSVFQRTATSQNVTISATASLSWTFYSLKFCTKTATPTNQHSSYHMTGCGAAISDLPAGARSFTRPVTVTQAMITNGGLVIVLYTSSDNNIVLAQWVPIEPRGIELSRSTLEITEQGSLGVYIVRLNEQPSGNVRVRAQRKSDDVEISFPQVCGAGICTVQWTDQLDMNFVAGNWNIGVTIRVRAPSHDADAADIATGVTHAIVSANTVDAWDAVPNGNLKVTVRDDETAATVVSPDTALAVTEGGTASYRVHLSHVPTDTVVVSVSSDDDGAARVAPAALTFGTTNWNTARAVTVRGVEDADREDATVTISHAVDAANSGDAYAAAETAGPAVLEPLRLLSGGCS